MLFPPFLGKILFSFLFQADSHQHGAWPRNPLTHDYLLLAQEILLIFPSYMSQIIHVTQDQEARTSIHSSQALIYE